jgi:heat shock 70kDa protein 1/2/6/8
LSSRFSEIPKDQPTTSALLIQHPEIADVPAYRVTRAGKEVILTVSEVSTLLLRSLLGSAQDFLGRKVTGAVVTVPAWFNDAQRAALQKSAEDAGVTVLQLLDETGAVAVTAEAREPHADLTALVVDLGQSALSLSLLSLRHGLAHSLAHSYHPDVSTAQIDDRLIRFFAKDFTKKTKTPLAVAPAGDKADARAEAKLRLAIEHTKRTIAASPGAATCSVESLKDGLDYTGSINRMRFDMEARPVYTAVVAKVEELLASASLDSHEVDEVVYLGGSGALPGLDEALAAILSESVVTPFIAGTIAGGGAGDPTTLLSRGAALEADLLQTIADDPELKAAFALDSAHVETNVLAKTLGVVFPAAEGEGEWIPLLPRETALPARRTVGFTVQADAGRVGIELWEAQEGVNVTKTMPPKLDDEEDELEEDEEEEIEVKERTLTRESCLGGLELKVLGGGKAEVQLQILATEDGSVKLSSWEVTKGGNGEAVTLSVGA